MKYSRFRQSVPGRPAIISLLLTGWLTGIASGGQPLDSRLPETVRHDRERLRQWFDVPTRVSRSGRFVIVYADREASPSQAAELLALLEATHERFSEDFTRAGFELEASATPLPWISIGGHKQFVEYGYRTERLDVTWLDGYYSPRTNRVVLPSLGLPADPATPLPPAPGSAETALVEAAPVPGLSTNTLASFGSRITHEAAHQLAFNTGLQRRGVMYPFWVSEGLAANFELQANGDLGLTAMNAVRRRSLARFADEDGLVPLPEFLTAVQVPGRSKQAADRYYCQAWSVFNFLFHYRRDALHGYMARLARFEPGRRGDDALTSELEEAFGNLDVLHDAWRGHVDDLLNPPAREAVPGAGDGLGQDTAPAYAVPVVHNR